MQLPIYQHGESDMTDDQAVLRIFGEDKALGMGFPFTILPKDDSLLFLVSIAIFRLAEGELVLTESSTLMFSDFDSSGG